MEKKMKKGILVSFFIIACAGYLFSKATPAQQKIAKAFPPESIGKCYKECKKSKDENECNKGIDDLEVAVNAMYGEAKSKELCASSEPIKKSLSIMKTACPKLEKKISKALKK